jgi:transposase
VRFLRFRSEGSCWKTFKYPVTVIYERHEQEAEKRRKGLSACKRTMRSRIDPMKKIAKMLRSHRGLILNWFRAKGMIALGAVEGLNNKAKVTTKKAYGFKNIDVIKIALYHTLGVNPCIRLN